jgi:IS1 family transposase
MVVNMLAEGVGIRAIARLAELNKKTVLRILETAGRHCEQIMEGKVRGLHVNEIEIDEAYAFVGCLQQNTKGPMDTDRGEQYAYLAIDPQTKLILHAHVGKRDTFSSRDFLEGLKPKIEGRFQLTSDSFPGYASPFGGVKFVFGESVDYATEEKSYSQLEQGKGRIQNPVVCTSVRRKARLGSPDMARATTNHVERANLSVRLFNRRFTRKTMGFSRKLENHRWSVILLAAHFNYCRAHSTHNQTPAMAAGLADCCSCHSDQPAKL